MFPNGCLHCTCQQVLRIQVDAKEIYVINGVMAPSVHILWHYEFGS